MFNYSWYIIINRNILFNAIVTRMNKYIIIIIKKIENGYFHIVIMISVTEILGGSGACSPRKF